jgi:universal stress protein E
LKCDLLVIKPDDFECPLTSEDIEEHDDEE